MIFIPNALKFLLILDVIAAMKYHHNELEESQNYAKKSTSKTSTDSNIIRNCFGIEKREEDPISEITQIAECQYCQLASEIQTLCSCHEFRFQEFSSLSQTFYRRLFRIHKSVQQIVPLEALNRQFQYIQSLLMVMGQARNEMECLENMQSESARLIGSIKELHVLARCMYDSYGNPDSLRWGFAQDLEVLFFTLDAMEQAYQNIDDPGCIFWYYIHISRKVRTLLDELQDIGLDYTI